MPHNIQTGDVSDTFLTGYLVLSPAWASWLVEFNELLTTISLLTGIGFALVRLWLSLRKRR